MFRFRSAIKFILPLAILDLRYRVRDIRLFLEVRRRYGDSSYASDLIAALRTFIRPKKIILYFPERPPEWMVEYKLCALLGYAITLNPNHRFDVAFKHMNTTFFDPDILKGIPVNGYSIINRGSIDISKRAVNAAFEDVFSYELEVDPTQYHGQIVEKSDINATHDGRIIQGPISPKDIQPGCVYQKAIDNTSDKEGFVLDYRVPIHKDQIPLVYLRYHPIERRFSENAFVKLIEPGEVLSAAELDKLIIFAKNMGVDYGELDVLRDRDGRIYVVDVNNTPAGPPKGLPDMECKRALQRMTKSFERMLDERKT